MIHVLTFPDGLCLLLVLVLLFFWVWPLLPSIIAWPACAIPHHRLWTSATAGAVWCSLAEVG